VVNGGLRISGNFKFKGVIIVQGDLDVTGTMTVVGAVIGLNTIKVGKDGTNNLGGTVNITYDPCVNRRVQQAFNDDNPEAVLARPPYGWFEVVR
jgi:cytoskeletal protein CcmA (bactofilin family)